MFDVKSVMEKVPKTTCEDCKNLQGSGEDHVVLDVREKEEWDAGHIDGALHIPRGLLEFKIEEAVSDKDKKIVVYCKTGGRASLEVQTLKEMGYSNVSSLEGGFEVYSQM